MSPSPPPTPSSTTRNSQWQYNNGSSLSSSLMTVMIAVVAVVISYWLPTLMTLRDDNNYTPPHRTNDELQALGVCNSGTTRIQLSSKTIDRLVSLNNNKDNNNNNKKQRKRPVDTVHLHYLTTLGERCSTKDNEKVQEETQEGKQHQQQPLPPKEHVLLVHGTGISSMAYTQTYYDNARTSFTSTSSMWNLFRQAGYDVTAVDLRGHGLSEITEGPYSVELLAADLAALIRQELLPLYSPTTSTVDDDDDDDNIDQPPHLLLPRLHCCGLSIGFGVCMALAVHDPDLVATISGNGWLFDRTNHDWKAWLFSRPIVVRSLGIWVLSWIGQVAMRVQTSNIVPSWMEYTHLEGFLSTARGWLEFNLSWALPTLQIATLFLLPQYDQDLGHTIELTTSEIASMPSGIGHVIEFDGYSHCMLGELGGKEKIVSTVLEFIQQQQPQQDK